MKFRQLGLIGCGLMGGSFALALKRAGLVERIVGYSASERSRARALELGVIDQTADSAAQAVQHADLVLLAVPVSATSATLQAIAPVLAPDALLMDVGSTKSDVVAAARATLGARLPCFVPAHPIAGKEVAGIEHAEASLYNSCLTILTPLESTGARQLEQARAVWQAVGSRILSLGPAEHDAAFAAVSHLPHLLAFAYLNGLLNQPQGSEHLTLAGPGFRDFSRIAASDPAIWHDILLANRAEVLAQARQFRQALDQLEAAITRDDGPALRHLIAQASRARAGWKPGGNDQD
jgi:prephenate dehydrogenase